MRLVSKTEDKMQQDRVTFLENLVADQRTEILRMRAQIDEAREIPPYVFDVEGKPGEVYVMDDKRMAKERGNGSETTP